MASMGFNFAQVHVQRKRVAKKVAERMKSDEKRKDDKGEERSDSSCDSDAVVQGNAGKKVYPVHHQFEPRSERD